MFMVCITGKFDRSFGDYSSFETGILEKISIEEVYQLFGSNKYCGLIMDMENKIWFSSGVFLKKLKNNTL